MEPLLSLQLHIEDLRKQQFRQFYATACLQGGVSVCMKEAEDPEAFFQTFRRYESDSVDFFKHLVFGQPQVSFLEKAVSFLSQPASLQELIHRKKGFMSMSKTCLWYLMLLKKPLLSTLAGLLPWPCSLAFDPKGMGRNMPGLLLSETIQNQQAGVQRLLWSQMPFPYYRNHMAPEVQKLLSLWQQTDASARWIYCHFQSLCHRQERLRSMKLLALAKQYPRYLNVLHISLDSPLYQKASLYCSMEDQYANLIRELTITDSLYQTSLVSPLKETWLDHAQEVALEAKLFLQEHCHLPSAQAFMELFSLGVCRRFVGFSLFQEPRQEVFLTQGCKESIDRGATWIFEMASFLTSLPVCKLQALLWGRSLLARGRLPQVKRMHGYQELILIVDKEKITSWLHRQLAKGLQVVPADWKLECIL